jgi:hypothetical protein
MFTSPLHTNGISSVVACIFISAGTGLPSRCLAMNFYSGSAIPAFRRHVTIISQNYFKFWIVLTLLLICQLIHQLIIYYMLSEA